VLQSVSQSPPTHFNPPLSQIPNLPDPKTIRSNAEHSGTLQRKKKLDWTHQDHNISLPARFNQVIRQNSVRDNDFFIGAHSDSKRRGQFREQGGGITSTGNMSAN
jgi:hypothetical protein